MNCCHKVVDGEERAQDLLVAVLVLGTLMEMEVEIGLWLLVGRMGITGAKPKLAMPTIARHRPPTKSRKSDVRR